MRKIIFLLLFIPVALFALSPAQNLQKQLKAMQTLSADFSQTITGESGQVLQTLSGHLMISRPRKFYWSVKKPIVQQIISDGEKVWIVEPDLEQVTINPLNKRLSETPILLLTKSVDLSQQFLVREVRRFVYELVPKNKEASFSRAEITFKNKQPIRLTLLNTLGQTTDILFSNINMNQPIAMKWFSYTVPKGWDYNRR